MNWPNLGLDRDWAINKTLFDEGRRVVGMYISTSFERWTTELLLVPKN